jgi:glycosyltransferase involved in cell wall biosynthesis
MAKQLSIIIPGTNEFPQNAFTVQNVITTLECTPLDYEVIYIDNKSTVEPNFLDGKAKNRLTTLHYDDKLSHWNAKMVGVEAAKATTLFFMDAHCILQPDSLLNMFKAYKTQYTSLNGSLHMPISYLLEVPGRELTYKHFYNKPYGIMHYSFTRMRTRDKIHKIPSMSSCGCMIEKEILIDACGGWPRELGIYGGGENFLNYTMAVLGYDKNIWPFNPIHHYAYRRGYSWNYDDFVRNHIIACYMWGGEVWVDRYIVGRQAIKGDKPAVLNGMKDDVISKCSEQREHIKSLQKYSPEEWMDKMREELPQYIHEDVK